MISITDVGAKKAKEFLEKRGSGFGLRVSITTTGCSGYAYKLEFADRVEEEDLEFFSNGIKLVVDKKSHLLIDGTVVVESFTV